MLAREIQPLKIAIDKHWHEKTSANERQLHSSEYVFWKQKMHLEKCLSNCFKCTALTSKIKKKFSPTCSGKFKAFNLALSRFDWHAGSTGLILWCSCWMAIILLLRYIPFAEVELSRATKKALYEKVGMWKCHCYFSAVLVRWTDGYIITCVSKLVS